jgi:4-methylaminobutanoate oxidase (formaldehyde-forming)
MIAEWVLDGEPSLDIHALDIRRFGSRHNRSSHFVAERSREHYSKHYKISWPHYHNQNERSLRRSPLYHVLEQKRAAFGEKSGWERAQWFAPEGVEPEEIMAWGRPNWHEHVGREVKAIREKVVLLDQTSFGKIEVRGPDALALLQRLATRNIDRPPGSLAYTQMCNGKGGIECDLTISRTGEEEFYLVTGTAFAAHDLSWIVNHIEPGQAVVAYDVTSSRGVLNLCGPRARQVLEKVTREDVSNGGFPFGTGREIYIGSAPALALRVSYHGELGWELHIPVEYTAYVYEKLWEAGEEFGIADAGYRSLESCRLEKGYFYWSGDLTTDYTPYDAGLGFNVHLKKDFIGRSALAKIVKEGPAWRMCFFTLEEEVELYGSEPISREGKVLGIVTSGGFGHTIGKTIAFAYLPPAEAVHSDYVIEAFGREIQVTRHDRCLYDPKRERILS